MRPSNKYATDGPCPICGSQYGRVGFAFSSKEIEFSSLHFKCPVLMRVMRRRSAQRVKNLERGEAKARFAITTRSLFGFIPSMALELQQ